MANAHTGNDSFQVQFDAAIQGFRVELKNDNLYREILQTRNVEELYDVTDKLQEEQSKTGRLRHLSKIEPFIEGLRRYASVIEVFMQAKPDVLALIWGPIKLLLQWADVMKQSMDAIVDTIAEIGSLIPEFRISSKLFGEKVAIRDIMLLFFGDILDFYVITLKFFSNTRLKIVFEALWPRQRDKIKIVTSHFHRHTSLLRNEVRLEHIQAEYDFRRKALERFDEAENSHRLQEYQSLRTSMATNKYEEKLHYLDGRSCKDAGVWLMKHIEFCNWIDRLPGSNPVLWLQGIPGSGKTHLAGTVVHEVRKRGHSLFAFLSYTHSTNVSALSILHSLAFQLSADNPTLQYILCQSSGENFRHNVDTAKSVFKTLALSAGNLCITIDGLDEIEAAPRCQILAILLQFSSEVDGLRLMVSSRAEADIASVLKGKCSSIRINELNTEGILAFISQRTVKWYNERDFFPEARKDIACLLAPLADKSKGMFLYAKIVLDTIEFLETDEILEDLKILPETMDDAYGRILSRINQQPASVREKARSIIGWIGVSPAPLAIFEVEQALLIQSQGVNGTAIVKSKYPIDRVCGPIVELVDGYLHFVHFTVQEYFLSPLIITAIDPEEARLSLTTCCISYLCQPHHDRTVESVQLFQLTLSGAYRFHNFAMLYWLNLVESVLSTYSSDALPTELVDILETLRTKRETALDIKVEQSCVTHQWMQLRQRRPELAAMLCNSISFRATCDKSSFRTRDIDWASLDPLDISRTSYHIHALMEDLLKPAQITQPTVKQSLARHYGERLFKCRYMSCSFRRHGFETKTSRNSHEKEHDKPWKCDIAGCEFENGGFLSRRMRDDHLKQYHNHHNALLSDEFASLDEADLRDVCLDLVKADDISTVKKLAATSVLDDKTYLNDMIPCAAQYASVEMMKTLLGQNGADLLPGAWTSPFDKLLLPQVVAGGNSGMLEYILHSDPADWDKALHRAFFVQGTWRVRELEGHVQRFRVRGLPEVLAKGNDEMLGIFCKWVELDISTDEKKHYLVDPSMIQATTGDIYREQILLELWKKTPSQRWSKSVWRQALINVATTTCSINLTRFLIGQGIPVDYTSNRSAPTALVHAARKTNVEAAELARFLLFNGAESVVPITRNRSGKDNKGDHCIIVEKFSIVVSEEKGARQISKWLGVSFEELIAQAKKARGGPEGSARRC